jgi:hypothetical protein
VAVVEALLMVVLLVQVVLVVEQMAHQPIQLPQMQQ